MTSRESGSASLAPAGGGRRAWLMWSAPALLFLVAFFHRPAPGIITRDLMRAFGASSALVGLLSATYFYTYAGGMVLAGVLIDAYGVRRVVSIGGAVMGLGAVAMGVAPDLGVLFAGRAVVGLGATVTFIGTLEVAAAWFPPARFGFLAALTATVGVLGSLVATVPLAWLVATTGWRGALVLVGVVTLAGAGLCAAIVRDAPAGPRGPAASGRSLGAVARGMVRVLANRHTWPPFLAFFCVYAASGNLMLWIVPYLRDVHRLATPDAALYASATALALLATGPLTGWVSDRVIRRRKLPYTVLTAAQLVLWIVFVTTLGRLPLGGVYALLFGMGVVGGAFVLTWPIGREVNPPELGAVAVAVVNLGGFLGAAVTQGPLGSLLDRGWRGASVGGARVYPVEAYRATFTVCLLLAAASVAISLFLRETRGRNVYGRLATKGSRT